ncbi:hypothetical protein CP8484711_0478B, partial [Chlamydia psittaci 84-8471/1]
LELLLDNRRQKESFLWGL